MSDNKLKSRTSMTRYKNISTTYSGPTIMSRLLNIAKLCSFQNNIILVLDIRENF